MNTKLKQAIILLEDVDKKMFPFDRVPISLLKIGNQPQIIRIIKQLLKNDINKIFIIGNYKINLIKHLLANYEVEIMQVNEVDKPALLSEIIETADTLIYTVTLYLNDLEFNNFVESYDGENNVALLTKLVPNQNSKNYIGAYADDNVENYFYAPRLHYVNCISGRVFIIKSDNAKYFKYNPLTFLKVNVGVSVIDKFYIEQSINDMLADGVIVKAYYTKEQSFLDHIYNILEANHLEVSKLNFKNSLIDESVKISNKAIIKGNVIIKANSVIGDNVIILGNCLIEENCVIDTGAIISENVIIGKNSLINNYAKINQYTVIGNNNKIGFNSEVSGVTFDNVAIVHNSHIAGLLGNNVDVGAGSNSANLRFDDQNQRIKIKNKYFKNKFTNNIFIGNNSRLAIGVLLNVGVRIGADSAVGAGVLLESDLDHNKIIIKKSETIIKEWTRKHEII